MNRIITLIFSLVGGVIFFRFAPIIIVINGISPLVTALSIMTAAVFVRLNRGIPALEWKLLELNERKRLTAAILLLTKEYAGIIAINSIFLIYTVILAAIGKNIGDHFSADVLKSFSGIIGTLGCLSVSRMTYVVWRDYDVVKLQKILIDLAGERELRKLESEKAELLIAGMSSAQVIKQAQIKPEPWDK